MLQTAPRLGALPLAPKPPQAIPPVCKPVQSAAHSAAAAQQRARHCSSTIAAAAAVEAAPSTTGRLDAFQEELNSLYPVTQEAVEHYELNGYVRLHNVFSAPLLETLGTVVTAAVAAADQTPLETDDEYARAFTQVMNIWESSPDVQKFVFSRRLAGIAAQLLQVRGVRMYHDQALFKQPGGGRTPWHADGYYFPLSSDKILTAWVPLQPVPPTMGPLEFAATSHRDDIGRHLGISGESERKIQEAVASAGYTVDGKAFQIGEVSFHSGWTFHRAQGNSTSAPRQVMTAIYMDQDMRMIEPQHANHRADHERWLPGVRPGEICDSHRNPVVYSS